MRTELDEHFSWVSLAGHAVGTCRRARLEHLGRSEVAFLFADAARETAEKINRTDLATR